MCTHNLLPNDIYGGGTLAGLCESPPRWTWAAICETPLGGSFKQNFWWAIYFECSLLSIVILHMSTLPSLIAAVAPFRQSYLFQLAFNKVIFYRWRRNFSTQFARPLRPPTHAAVRDHDLAKPSQRCDDDSSSRSQQTSLQRHPCSSSHVWLPIKLPLAKFGIASL